VTRRWTAKGAVPLAVLAVLLTHAISLGNGFVDFDDPVIFLENPLLRRSDAGALADIFAFDRRNWRPLRDVSHWLDHLVHGQHPLLAHLHNLLLLIPLVWLAARTFVALGASRGVAAVAAAIAFVHPVQVEVIAWVSGRKDLLAGICFFASVLAFLTAVRGRRALNMGAAPNMAAALNMAVLGGVACLAFMALGVMAKGHLIALPAVLGALLLHAKWRGSDPDVRAVGAIIAGAALVAVAMAPLVLRGDVVLPENLRDSTRTSLLLTDRLQLPLRYVGHLVWPIDLNHIYLTQPIGTAHDIVAGASVLLTVAGLVWLAAGLRARRPDAALTLVPLGLMLPFLHLAEAGTVYMADRYLFLALPFVSLLAVGAAQRAMEARRITGGRQLGAAGAVALLLALLCLPQHAAWRNSATLWTRMTQVYPASDWGFDRLGQAMYRAREYKAAAGAFIAASERAPDRGKHYNNAAVALMAMGDYRTARTVLQRALAMNPQDATARRNLGRVDAHLGAPGGPTGGGGSGGGPSGGGGSATPPP
jgi:hypothetical protein